MLEIEAERGEDELLLKPTPLHFAVMISLFLRTRPFILAPSTRGYLLDKPAKAVSELHNSTQKHFVSQFSRHIF